MRDKQVEEMAIVLSDGGCRKCDCDANGRFNCKLLYDAELLYNAGYRKASDVAREIFEEIEKLMNKLDKRHIACGNPKQAWGVRSAMTELAELKKKYESEGEG